MNISCIFEMKNTRFSTMSRNTVKKYIDQDLLARKQDTRKLPISTNSAMPPAYKKRVNPKKVLTKSAMRRICEMLKQNK